MIFMKEEFMGPVASVARGLIFALSFVCTNLVGQEGNSNASSLRLHVAHFCLAGFCDGHGGELQQTT